MCTSLVRDAAWGSQLVHDSGSVRVYFSSNQKSADVFRHADW